MAYLKKISQLLNDRILLIGILVIMASLQFALMIGNVQGVKYDITLFSLSPETIRSVKTVEDLVKTEEERERVAKEVAPVYSFSADIATNRASIVTSVFDFVLDVKQSTNSVVDIDGNTQPNIDAQIEALRTKLKALESDGEGLTFTNEELRLLLVQSNDDIRKTRNSLAAYVKDSLSKPLRADKVPDVKNTIEDKIRADKGNPSDLQPLLVKIGRYCIEENETVNPELTKASVEQAKNNVEPTKILQGQVIVQEGQLIDREVYRQLELAGMLKSQNSIKPTIGLLLMIVLQMWFFFTFFARWKEEQAKKKNALLITAVVYILSISIMKIISIASSSIDNNIAFLFPTALAPLLVRLLVNEKLAVLMTIMTGASAGVLFQEGYSSVVQMETALYIIFSGLAALYFIREIDRRSKILQSSLVISAVNILFITFYLLLSQSEYGVKELLFYVGSACISGVLSSALTLGTLPFFESAFRMLSTIRLIELSNPNHPLLRKILVETPGTYHHSVMVANLAETACEAVGADGLLARVGCYYHDIGKTKRPSFFIENQHNGVNPHDSIPPETSRDIIIAHATEGAKLLEEHQLPKEIIDIAQQHHGTSLLKFFYYKAKEQGREVDEAEYRYPGPKPQTKEIAIISVADSVEAAVRSMKEPNPDKIKNLVRNIMKDKLQDGQFDDCDLSIRDLKIIENVLCETLNGIFHSRIEYPNLP